jgi:hypothetical protein
VKKWFLHLFAQPVIVKFITNKNVKHAEILKKPRAQFGDEVLSSE